MLQKQLQIKTMQQCTEEGPFQRQPQRTEFSGYLARAADGHQSQELSGRLSILARSPNKHGCMGARGHRVTVSLLSTYEAKLLSSQGLYIRMVPLALPDGATDHLTPLLASSEQSTPQHQPLATCSRQEEERRPRQDSCSVDGDQRCPGKVDCPVHGEWHGRVCAQPSVTRRAPATT